MTTDQHLAVEPRPVGRRVGLVVGVLLALMVGAVTALTMLGTELDSCFVEMDEPLHAP